MTLDKRNKESERSGGLICLRDRRGIAMEVRMNNRLETCNIADQQSLPLSMKSCAFGHGGRGMQL